MKTCTTCGCTKPPTEFYPKHGRCKVCYQASRQSYLAQHKAEIAEQRAKFYKNNRDKIVAERKAEREKNKELVAARRAAFRLAHPDKVKEHAARHYANNKDRIKAKTKEYVASVKHTPEYKAKKCIDRANRRARELQATASWTNAALVNFYYVSARYLRETGLEVDVDHIVPLRGKQVSGLHVHNNLQLALSSYNKSKGNKM